MKVSFVLSKVSKLINVFVLVFMTGMNQYLCADDFTEFRTIDIDEAAKICMTLPPNFITDEVYELEGVVRGTCNSRRDRLMLNVDLWQGEKMLFAYRLSSFDSLAFAHRFDLAWGDTVVVRTRLENYKERPCSYYGYLVSIRKYVNPANELIKANLDKEWKVIAQARSNEAHARMLWVTWALAVIAFVVLMVWLWSVHHHLTHDSLTQLYNRKGGEFQVKGRMRFKVSGYLCLLDINGFKEVNDRFGHRAGDQCLKEFAAMIREEFNGCVTMRMDGNEFAVYVERMSREDLNMLMEDFFGRVQDLRIPGDPDYQITVSVGTAYYDGEGGYSQLFHRADQSLYKSKFHKGNWLT